MFEPGKESLSQPARQETEKDSCVDVSKGGSEGQAVPYGTVKRSRDRQIFARCSKERDGRSESPAAL